MVRPAGNFSSQEAPSTSGISTAINAIMVSEMPSTPRVKLIPNVGIQSTLNTSWKGTTTWSAAVPMVDRYATQSAITTTSSASEKVSATSLTVFTGAPDMAARTTAPAIG